MNKRFKNKYRISSARMQNWDYGSNTAYFITICTQDRIRFFGEFKKTSNTSGKIAKNIWILIPQQFPYAHLADFVIMPNQMHSILIIDKTNYCIDVKNRMNAINRVSTVNNHVCTCDRKIND